MGTALDRPASGATDLAEAAARRCGLTIARVDTPSLAIAGADLLRDIWRSPNGWPVPPEILLVLTHTDNYAVVAHSEGRVVAASAAWRTGDAKPHLHSHITGVVAAYRGRSVGHAVKLHQRAWALDRGIRTITWTFDPLQRRNAAFNLLRLGARVSRYLPDFYGPMTDGVNAGTPSDRALVEWDLVAGHPPAPEDAERAQPLIYLDPQERPRPAPAGKDGAELVTIRVPEDIETLRRLDPTLAREWQLTVSKAFQDCLAAGYHVVGFHPQHHYLLRRREPHAS